MANASLKAVISLLALASCATPTSMHYWCSGERLEARGIEQVLKDNPLAAEQDIRVTNLGSTTGVSHHIVQVRTSEALHIHKDHDLTVFVYRGQGTLTAGGNLFLLRAGDSVLIPRGLPHAFRNSGKVTAVAIAVFNPAFDGKDTVPVSGEK